MIDPVVEEQEHKKARRNCPRCGSDSWLKKVLCKLEEEDETSHAFTFRILMYQCKNMDECGQGWWRCDHPIKFARKNR